MTTLEVSLEAPQRHLCDHREKIRFLAPKGHTTVCGSNSQLPCTEMDQRLALKRFRVFTECLQSFECLGKVFTGFSTLPAALSIVITRVLTITTIQIRIIITTISHRKQPRTSFYRDLTLANRPAMRTRFVCSKVRIQSNSVVRLP